MRNTDLVKNIVQNFVKGFNNFVNKGIISSEALDKYWDFNVHSILQYCLIVAAMKSNVVAIPEYRLRFSEPIDKQAIDSRLKSKQQYIRTLRVDVGFLVDSRLIGVGRFTHLTRYMVIYLLMNWRSLGLHRIIN